MSVTLGVPGRMSAWVRQNALATADMSHASIRISVEALMKKIQFSMAWLPKPYTLLTMKFYINPEKKKDIQAEEKLLKMLQSSK